MLIKNVSNTLMLVCVLFYTSCIPTPHKEFIESTNIELFNSLTELGFQVELLTVVQDDRIRINMYFKDKYFLLDKSNEMLFLHLLSNSEIDFSDFNTIFISFKLDKLSDGSAFEFTKEELSEKIKEYKMVPLYDDLVELSLKQFKTGTIIRYGVMIEELRTIYLPNKFKGEGSYWDLLRAYAISPCNSKSQSVYDMETILFADSIMEHPMNPTALKKVINLGKRDCK